MQDMEINPVYMQRCIELARSGLGKVAPNPMVGAVIVYENTIIGEGYHQQYGKAHAEVHAVESVKNKSLLSESTLYVSLEPCDHFGKTPPCTALILNHKIPRVVIGTVDPFDAVAGNGISRLRNAGLQVQVGILKSECNFLNRRFFTFHQKKRPYIILKWAQSQDGYLDKVRQQSDPACPTWITSPRLRALVHKWRTEEQAILVGANTALMDNPRLNVREWNGNNPLRILIDPKLQVPETFHLFDGSQPTIIFNEVKDLSVNTLDYIRIDVQKSIPEQILEVLHQKSVQSVIIEGGRMVLNTFIEKNLWDEARVFYGTPFFKAGVPAPVVYGKTHETIGFEKETLRIFYNQLF